MPPRAYEAREDAPPGRSDRAQRGFLSDVIGILDRRAPPAARKSPRAAGRREDDGFGDATYAVRLT